MTYENVYGGVHEDVRRVHREAESCLRVGWRALGFGKDCALNQNPLNPLFKPSR